MRVASTERGRITWSGVNFHKPVALLLCPLRQGRRGDRRGRPRLRSSGPRPENPKVVASVVRWMKE